MKTVITGATGHVGINLIRNLVDQGREVVALLHDSDMGLENLPIKRVKGDISDINSLTESFRDAEVVYHLAAHISLVKYDKQKCNSINIDGVRNVVEACKLAGVKRLVHFSSIHSLRAEPQTIPINEARPFVDIKKATPYDRSKAMGEMIVRQAVADGMNAIIIKPTGIVGPYDYRPSHFGQAFLIMASGMLPASVNGGFDWVDVRDVAKYAIIAEEKAPPGANYLLSGNWLSVKELSEMVASVAGSRNPYFVCPMSIAKICAPVITTATRALGGRHIFTSISLNALETYRAVSHDKATRELGYNPRPLSETIADTVAWFRDNGYLKCD